MKRTPVKPGRSYGGVVFNQQAQVMLREPENHYDGYAWTFPKGRANPGESAEEAALREVREETGIEARIVKLLPGEFKGGTGFSIYFLMTAEKETGQLDWETQSIAWVDRNEAEVRIQQTTNQLGRERDLKVLTVAFQTLYEKPQV